MTLQMLDRKILTDEQPLPCTFKHCKMLSKYFDSIRVKIQNFLHKNFCAI